MAKFQDYHDIDRAVEEKMRGITMNASRVGYETSKRHYSHTDCPGHLDFIKNMITGTSQMDASILVVAANDGTMPQTREHILLAKQVGVKYIIVYVNKVDIVDDEVVELVELETRELLDEFKFDGSSIPFIYGSALKALNGEDPEIGEKSILKLLDTVDEYVKIPDRDVAKPFYMSVQSAVPIKGRGTVVVGTLERGSAKAGTTVEITGGNITIKSKISDIQVFNQSVPMCKAGDHVGLLCTSVKVQQIIKGMVVMNPGTYTMTNCFKAAVYILQPNEGGRHLPIVDNYEQLFFSKAWNISCRLSLNEGEQMIMPGDNTNVRILLKKGMVLEQGQKFTIRENALTTVTGIITELLPIDEAEHKGFNKLEEMKFDNPHKRGKAKQAKQKALDMDKGKIKKS